MHEVGTKDRQSDAKMFSLQKLPSLNLTQQVSEETKIKAKTKKKTADNPKIKTLFSILFLNYWFRHETP